MGVVEDGRQRFPRAIEAERLLDESAFTLEGAMVEVDTKGITEDLDRVGVGVQSPGHAGDEVLVFGESQQRLLDHRFSGAGNAEHQAQAALLTMHFQRVMNLLLLGQQLAITQIEGIARQSVEGSYHGCSFRRRRPLATASSRR